MKVKWTLDEALTFCRELQKYIVGFSVGMTGGVLHKGNSCKDLDIIVFPNSTALHLDPQGLRLQFIEFGMRCMLNRDQVRAEWKKQGSEDTKHVEVWNYKGKRIDVFYLD